MTVQGPVKKQQPDGMSHRGGGGGCGVSLDPTLCPACRLHGMDSCDRGGLASMAAGRWAPVIWTVRGPRSRPCRSVGGLWSEGVLTACGCHNLRPMEKQREPT